MNPRAKEFPFSGNGYNLFTTLVPPFRGSKERQQSLPQSRNTGSKNVFRKSGSPVGSRTTTLARPDSNPGAHCQKGRVNEETGSRARSNRSRSGRISKTFRNTKKEENPTHTRDLPADFRETPGQTTSLARKQVSCLLSPGSVSNRLCFKNHHRFRRDFRQVGQHKGRNLPIP